MWGSIKGCLPLNLADVSKGGGGQPESAAFCEYGAELASEKATQAALRDAGLEGALREVQRLLASTGMSPTDWLAPVQHSSAAPSVIHNLAAAVGADGALLQPVPAATGAAGPAKTHLPSLDPVGSGVSDLVEFNALSL